MIGETVFNALATGSPLPTDAETRVFALVAAEGSEFPRIVYQVIAATPTTSLDGDSHKDYDRVQVTSWARTYEGANTLAEQAKAALELIGAMPAGAFDDFDTTERAFSVKSDFYLWHNF